MELMTKAIAKKLKDHPLLSTGGNDGNAEVIVKYFNPYEKKMWLATEGAKRDDDWIFYGLVHDGDWDWTYFYLSKLENDSDVERDYSCDRGHHKVKEEAYGCPDEYLEPVEDIPFN